MNVNELLFQLKQSTLFSSLTEKQIKKIISIARTEQFAPGQVITRESEKAQQLFFVLSGSVEVVKEDENGVEHRIATISIGEPIGELAMITESAYSATTRTIEYTEVVIVPIEKIRTGNKWRDIYNLMSQTLVSTLSKRLLRTSVVATSGLSQEYRLMQERLAFGKLFFDFIFILSFYWVGMEFIHAAERSPLVGSYISLVVSFLQFMAMLFLLLVSDYNLSEFGFTRENALSNTLKGLYLTVPLMVLVVISKWLLMVFYFHEPMKLIACRDAFSQGNFNTNQLAYYFSLLSFVLMAPMQEIIVRSGLQVSLERFFHDARRYYSAYAILLSNLIFAAMHIHKDTITMLALFGLGCFWGWLFTRYRSIIVTTFSHIVLGLWTFYIVW